MPCSGLLGQSFARKPRHCRDLAHSGGHRAERAAGRTVPIPDRRSL